MKTLFAFAALVSLAALPVRAHPGHDSSVTVYGVFWKNDPQGKHDTRRPLPEDIWRFAFVSKFRW